MTFSRLAVAASFAAVFAALGCTQTGRSAPGNTIAPTNSQPPAPIHTGTPTPPPPAGPTVASAKWVDTNASGVVDAGDQVIVTFSKEVVLSGTTAGDFVLPVTGDRFGQNATVATGTVKTDVIVTLGQGAVLTIPGTFDPTVLKAGSPSGVDVAIGQQTIKDVQGNRAAPSLAKDIGAAPPPPPAAFTMLYATFADVNSSGKVAQFDTITLGFSDDVVLGTGPNAPAIADFTLPVTGDAFGVAAYIKAGVKTNEVVIVLGLNPNLTIPGTFDKIKTTPGSPSGIGPASTLTAAKLSGKTSGAAVPAGAIDIDGTLAPPSGPHLTYVKFTDTNMNGKLDAGDVLVLGFSGPVDMGFGSKAPRLSDILLPVKGDTLDPMATFGFTAKLNEISITLGGPGAVFNPNGIFDPAVVTSGSASGLGLANTLPSGAIVDFNTRKDVATGTVVDIDGTLTAPKPPLVVSAFWVDRDLDGTASAGDWLVLEFSQPVRVDPTKATASDFQLPVSGDSFGAGATVQAGPRSTEVTIVLGTSPVITVAGTFDPKVLTSGSPSGVDVGPAPTPGAVVNAATIDMAAATIAWDVQAPVGALDNPMSNDKVNDTKGTTADWNVGGSGKIVASAKLDVGSGTTPLSITSDTTIDTTSGAIGGTTPPEFKGAGVFEYSTIDVAKGVTITVTGQSPLVLKATGAANVNGTFVMDGTKGDDNPVTYGGVVGRGGKPGPGGFAGGDGAAGGAANLMPGAAGLGPNGGQGGGTDFYAGGGGGAGFANAGKPGQDGTAAGAPPPAGKGGGAGAQGSAALLQLVQLVGGSGGAGGGAMQQPTPTTPSPFGATTSPGAGGGGGGGAFRLAAGGAVTFGGKVSVNGGAGGTVPGGYSGGGAGGGGAGGSVLVQSVANVTINPSATFLAKGGKGGTGTAGGDGSDGVVLVEAKGKLSVLTPAITGLVRPVASEGVVSPALATGAGTDDLVISSSSVLDTDKGLLNGVALPSFKGTGSFEVKNFTVAQGATLEVAGSAPLTVLASGKVDVSGTINLSGPNGSAAVGLNGGLGAKGRAGGADGGTGGSLTLGPGQTVASTTPPQDGKGLGAGGGAANGYAAGGAGGSFGTDGMNGLVSGGLGTPGTAGVGYGTADLATLAGGSGAGGGAANTQSGQYEGGAGGGAGGGAIAIQCAGDVSVSGAINANGGDGGTSVRGGDGGAGSGGAIALRSLGHVTVAGTLSAIGGDGKTLGGPGGDGRVRLEDTVGSFAGGTISPTLTQGTFTTSIAVSTWIRTMAGPTPATAPRFLAILNSGQASGAVYAAEIESAKDSAGAPDLTTATGFQSDVNALVGEWVRFRVTLKLGTGTSPSASVDRLYAPFK